MLSAKTCLVSNLLGCITEGSPVAVALRKDGFPERRIPAFFPESLVPGCNEAVKAAGENEGRISAGFPMESEVQGSALTCVRSVRAGGVKAACALARPINAQAVGNDTRRFDKLLHTKRPQPFVLYTYQNTNLALPSRSGESQEFVSPTPHKSAGTRGYTIAIPDS